MTDDIQLKVFIWIMIWLRSRLKASPSKILTWEDFQVSINDLQRNGIKRGIAIYNVHTAANIKPCIHLHCPWNRPLSHFSLNANHKVDAFCKQRLFSILSRLELFSLRMLAALCTYKSVYYATNWISVGELFYKKDNLSHRTLPNFIPLNCTPN